MTEMTRCGNPEALIAFVYDECDPAERESIAAHLAMCATCAEEIQSLRDTRAHLGAWSPPSLPLGFQITRTEADKPGKVLRPAAFWSRPLPAWAQVAAAAVIFAAGMSVSSLRSSSDVPARVEGTRAMQPAPVAELRPVSDFSVTRAEFARLEARLRAMERTDASRASYAQRGTDSLDTDMMARLTALEQRLARSERETTGNFAQLASAVYGTRREIDATRDASERVSVIEGELQQHREVLRNVVPAGMARVAYTSGR